MPATIIPRCGVTFSDLTSWKHLLWLGVYLSIAAAVQTQPAAEALAESAPPRVAAISAALQPFVERGDLAGAVALVGQRGKIVHLDGVGLADVESQRPMRGDTVFSIMSMTKPIAAVAALICCDEGKLSLDQPLATWLPEFKAAPHNTITLRQALTHTSGLFSDQRNTGTLAATVARLAKQKLQFEPGSRWMYGPGLTVAGRAVEVASGMPFDQFVAKRICEPLAMSDTGFRLTPEDEQRLASTYAYNSRDKKLTRSKFDFFGPMETRSPNPSGGLYSTAADLFRFYQLLLQRGELDGVRLLKPETVDEMCRVQTGDLKAGFVPGTVYGLGVGVVRESEGVTAMLSPGSFGHGGMLGTQAWADPHNEAVMILLIQRVGLPNGDGSEYRLEFQRAAAAALTARP